MALPDKCAKCDKAKDETPMLCRKMVYCSDVCQTADWANHKIYCKNYKSRRWWDDKRWDKRGPYHHGELGLVTWEPKHPVEMGWGATVPEEAEELKRKFEEEFQGDEECLYQHWPQAFRWSCCGVNAESQWGCYHHGTGPNPYKCDYCPMADPVSESGFKTMQEDIWGMGLQLSRGPDPRYAKWL